MKTCLFRLLLGVSIFIVAAYLLRPQPAAPARFNPPPQPGSYRPAATPSTTAIPSIEISATYLGIAPMLLADCQAIPPRSNVWSIDGMAGCDGTRVVELVIETESPSANEEMQQLMISLLLPGDATCATKEDTTTETYRTVTDLCTHPAYGAFAFVRWYEASELVAVGVLDKD